MGPVCAAFIGCQQMEKDSEKSVKTSLHDRQRHTGEEFKRRKKKRGVPALEPTVRTHSPTNDRHHHFLFF